jgi:hypothetical protein
MICIGTKTGGIECSEGTRENDMKGNLEHARKNFVTGNPLQDVVPQVEPVIL